jgi:uncharacterized protein (TIGR00255 family)
MTGYASGQGEALGLRWSWELRSVNGKGLDLRIRVPDWVEGLDQALRQRLSGAVKRGNVTVSLRLQSAGASESTRLNTAQLNMMLDAIAQAEQAAEEKGLKLLQSSAAEVINLRGVLDASAEEVDPAAIRLALLDDFEPMLADFLHMRASEGQAIADVLTAQLAEIETLTNRAAEALDGRKEEQAQKLKAALARVLDTADDMDPDRLAQELALIAVKTDVTEELDRLRAHITAARDLLIAKGPVGRKMDFLMQEFNREANTLCSKSQSAPLTAIGLDLKTVIDQLREQVQNLE